MTLFEFIRRVFRKLYAFVLTLIIVPLSIVVILFCFTPIYILRYFASWASKCFRPDLKKMLTTRSSLLAVDDMYRYPRASVQDYIVLERPPPLDETRKFLLKTTVSLRKPNGELAYPELSQWVYEWMGFFFWKQEDNFNIEDHCYEYNGALRASSYDYSALTNISNELNAKPFVRGRSPWEFILFHNYKKDQNDDTEAPSSVGVFNFHHSLADGYAVLSVLTSFMTSEGSMERFEIKYPPTSIWRKLIVALVYPFLAPFELVEVLLESNDSNEWRVPEKQLSRLHSGKLLDKIPNAFIKEIKNLHGVSFNAVLLAGFVGGVRRFMLENNVKVPEAIHCAIPFPMPGKAGKLRNYTTGCFLKLPIGIKSPQERLKKIDSNQLGLRKSTTPLSAFYIAPLVGGLFSCMIRPIAKQGLVTALNSNVPGPPHRLSFLGIPITDMFFVAGLLPGNTTIAMSSVSYMDNLRIVVGLNNCIIPEGVEVSTLGDKILQELDELKSSAYV